MAGVCEKIPFYPPDEVYNPGEVPPVEALKLFGWTFATSPWTVRKRQFDRMDAIDRMLARNQAEKRQRYIATAYYGLELSAALRPLADVIEDYEHSSSPTQPRLLDEIAVVSLVDQALNYAYDTSENMTNEDIGKLREATEDFKPDNTGSLKALRTMSKTSERYGWLSNYLTDQAAVLIRLCLAEEKGIDWHKPKEPYDEEAIIPVS